MFTLPSFAMVKREGVGIASAAVATINDVAFNFWAFRDGRSVMGWTAGSSPVPLMGYWRGSGRQLL